MDQPAESTEDHHSVSVSRRIPASPETIFAVLRDPSLHSVIDGSGTVRSSRAPRGSLLEMGSKFGMNMRMGLPYIIANTVVEYEPDRRIAWQHFGGHRWRYTLEPVGDDTIVTETFDWENAFSNLYITGLRWPQRHLPNMERTLARLEAFVVNRRQPI